MLVLVILFDNSHSIQLIVLLLAFYSIIVIVLVIISVLYANSINASNSHSIR